MASMLQEAGLAEVLVVGDVLRALEHDPSKVTYVVRALAWNKLSEEEQSKALNEAREHRGALELPYQPSFSSKQGNSLCEHCDGMMYKPALNADSEDKLRYHNHAARRRRANRAPAGARYACRVNLERVRIVRSVWTVRCCTGNTER